MKKIFFKKPSKLSFGDKIAIVSPSSGAAFLFPWVYELGLQRLQDELGLVPIVFPTALQSPAFLSKNPQARADDINRAFADPEIKAILVTTGGNDEIRILPYLNADIISAHPKIFLGYSDHTNMHLFLYGLGMVSYYGCSVMSQLAMQGSMHDYTKKYLQKVLFESNIGEIQNALEWTDVDLDWAKKENLSKMRPMQKSPGWIWHNAQNKKITGRLFGGCLEILELHMAAQAYMPASEHFDDMVLYFETSEELPSAGFVYRFLAALAERGLLQRIKALLVAIPKTQFMNNVPSRERENFMIAQRNAILQVLADYKIDSLPVVFNLHFGHVDPQFIIPNGGEVIIDGIQKRIVF
ncbi:LD-carboxypeptidase [Candidatus Dependentiae bacterium]|nr:LD-carboxypeptidase [Candidatus Dependentiae bacterium]